MFCDRIEGMTDRYSRRDFLRLSGTALAAALLPPLPRLGRRSPGLGLRPQEEGPARMGRAIHAVTLYDAFGEERERLGSFSPQEVFPIKQEIRAPGLNRYNDLWYETPDGYVFSAWVQPLWIWPPQLTETEVGEWGFWGEICAPFTDARTEPHPQARSPYRFYNGTVYHVVDVEFDEFGDGW